MAVQEVRGVTEKVVLALGLRAEKGQEHYKHTDQHLYRQRGFDKQAFLRNANGSE